MRHWGSKFRSAKVHFLASVPTRESGAFGLTLSTAVDNVNAQAIYGRAGYDRDDAFYVYNRFFESAL